MIEGVKIDERRENIIIYYNTLFVPSVRQYLKQMRQTSAYLFCKVDLIRALGI